MMEGCCSRFTAAEGGARLAAAAATKNILAVEYASFIPVRLLYEKAYQIRGSLKEGKKRSVYITRATRVQVVAFELKILTDLGTVAALAYEDVEDWVAELEAKEVLICTSTVLKKILEEQLLTMSNINVLVVDSCHLIYRDDDLKYIMKSYKQCPQEDQPTILALTYPLFAPNKKDTDEKDDPETKDERTQPKEEEMTEEDLQKKKETQDAQAALMRKKESPDKSPDEKEMDEPLGALPRMTVTVYEEMGLYENVDDFDMYEKLEWKIEELEQELCCQMDLAEDIDGGKRITSSAKPRELIIEYSARPSDEKLPPLYIDLETYMKETVQDALEFIEDHRHDPTEIYGDEMYDEFMSIPHPTIDPKNIFKQFLYVLEQLGPYAADKAAICLLIKLEKLKIKIPYERHFILMCLCTTVFIKIRCYAELLFDQIKDEWERIKTFSSPKIMRFAEILETFRPTDTRIQNLVRHDSGNIPTDTKDNNETVTVCDNINKESVKKMLNDIEECDFTSLGNKIQDRVNTYESNLKDIDTPSDDNSKSSSKSPDTQICQTDSNDKSDNSNDISNSPSNTTISETDTTDKGENSINKTDTQTDTRVSGMDIRGNEIMVQQRGLIGFTRRTGQRLRGKTRIQRNNAARVLQMQQNPDALCGIVYMKEPLIAKIMYSIIVDMTRSNSRLKFISAQYCATETPADPGTEPRECQRQGKRQEDVLKKFRMHECNLLLATPALEEGIDLPRCNLVLRWDVPVSYRSYGLCRGRARASRSTAALLCSNNTESTEMLLHNVATYRELDQIISRKCGCGVQDEPPQSEEDHADAFTNFIKPYSPNDNVLNNTAISNQKINFEDNHKIKDDSVTNVTTVSVIDSVINLNVDQKDDIRKKSKNKSQFDGTKTGKRNDFEKDKDYKDEISKNIDKEDSRRSKDICLEDSSNNDNSIGICEGNNNKTNDKSTENNNIEGVNINIVKTAIDNNNANLLANNKVNEAMDLVNDTINTVNDAINTVNEAIKQDGMDDLIHEMEDLTTLGTFNAEITQQNSETGEIEVNLDNRKVEIDSQDGNQDKIQNLEVIEKYHKPHDTNIEISSNDIPNSNPGDIPKQLTITGSSNDIPNSNPGDIPKQFTVSGSSNDILNSNPSDIPKQLAVTGSSNDVPNWNSGDIPKQLTVTVTSNDIPNTNPSDIPKQLAVTGSSNDVPNWNSGDIPKQLTVTVTSNDIPNSDPGDIPKQLTITENLDTKIAKDNEPRVHCIKCFNVKIDGVCMCSNVILYTQLSAKANLSRSEGKRNGSDPDSPASVDLSTAIALINRYCGKLPSDTFTRLAPQWWMEEVQLPVTGTEETKTAYICTLRLPLNCPVKYNIVGHPMPTKVLARRMVALQACRILHKSGELDNQLMPIGKENFKAVELEAVNTMCAYIGGEQTDTNDSARPGSTKRRQYYYKRTAWAFTDCQPVIDTTDAEIFPGLDPEEMDIESDIEAPKKEDKHKEKHKEAKVKEGSAKKRNMLYAIVSKLWCALPERYNTRGRRLHAPQLASQAIGILMSRHEPDNLQIPSFPVYTRSGEVRVSVEHVPDADVRMCPRRAKLVRRFMRFVFAEVLRVRRRGMKLQSEGTTHNNYYIVPTVKTTLPDGATKIDIDWSFLELIYQHTEEKKNTDIEKPIIWTETADEDQKVEKDGNRRRKGKKRMANPLLKKGEVFMFDAEKYREAVVTPWYRNQDQPQFFLVAEICWNLTPDSSFPSASHQSFRDYYSTKYGVSLTQREQPLLDVDHTSARLNLLTPRYVNRKGVALPVSSERTRRAKRDRLDQKQILIPELCRVHPFAAPLWFATVALPCVLYRINALLIADEIRRAVAIDVGLGIPKINDEVTPKFQWPPLDFGWSLAEVLSQDSEKQEKRKDDEESKKDKQLRDKEDSVVTPEGEGNSSDEKSDEEVKEKTINDILQEKEEAAAEAAFEIGTWSNDMASSIPETSEYDDLREPLPPNLTFCTSASGGTNWCDPIGRPKFTQYNPAKNFSMADSDDSFSSDLDSDDTDLDYDGSEDDVDNSGFCSSKNTNTSMGVRIEYKTAHEAEAFDIERTKKVNPAPMPDEIDDANDRAAHDELIRQGSAPQEYIDKFRCSVSQHKQEIIDKCHLITKDDYITEILPESKDSYHSTVICRQTEEEAISELFPFGTEELTVINGQIDVESIERNKRVLLAKIKKKITIDDIKKMNCFSMKDINIDDKNYVNEKVVNVGFDTKERYEKICTGEGEFEPYYADFSTMPSLLSGREFDFDYQPTLEGHPGPSPSVILQALTMSNANDGINLERLETIGDSFLKFAITAYLYCAHPTVHEGKLSHMRSKQVSNLNLYRLGRNKRLGARMIASKFEPHDNWLPPCHKPPPTLHPRINGEGKDIMQHLETPLDSAGCFIPYNLITQHSIPDKSIADCVEALIGAYLLECGPRGALLFMSWLGIRVLPCHHVPLRREHGYVRRHSEQSTSPTSPESKRSSSSSSSCSDDEAPPHQEMFPEEDWSWPARAVGSLQPYKDAQGRWMQPIFGELKAPPSPLLRYIDDPEGELNQMLSGYDALETTLQYRFKDRSLLLQALTHASHHSNRLTDCYQRLEFLGDAILDYLITRHLYEDPRRHSPGALTDLRSALVNNTIFATLAARHGFHKYFRHMSPGLNEVLTKYVKIQEENGHSISEEHYLIQEDEMEQAEDVEVPKALGDLFESVAGAIFLDSGMSLGAVWKSYVNLMGAELEAFSAAAPKSPVRELLEAEPDTAKFGKPERLADGRRVRVCVEVFGRGTFKGVGRNYRIAKGTAARCALRHLKGTRVDH